MVRPALSLEDSLMKKRGVLGTSNYHTWERDAIRRPIACGGGLDPWGLIVYDPGCLTKLKFIHDRRSHFFDTPKVAKGWLDHNFPGAQDHRLQRSPPRSSRQGTDGAVAQFGQQAWENQREPFCLATTLRDQLQLMPRCLFLDIRQAFDTISWDYMLATLATLTAFVIPPEYIRWVRLLYSEPRARARTGPHDMVLYYKDLRDDLGRVAKILEDFGNIFGLLINANKSYAF
ncbi:hypothetical protein NDU88_002971 [Pleurodeles waltl]|uniref:Reverse transcriptase domain-containing protein n=1 Tax=Pleurodeles waltl TaxID=8319 RepID=A0AAV7T3D9_PLEWA|nr:hypothetical protein NDU88_002971 [Pleurodeles waltl]